MSNDHLRNPLPITLSAFTKRETEKGIELTGRSLPCSVTKVDGQIVTVKFEMQAPPTAFPPVTMPYLTNIYARAPIQVGDKGVAMSADVYIGGMTGLGGGVADFTQQANLSTHVFVPVANRGWADTSDPDAYVIQGVGTSGVQLLSGDGNTTQTLSSTGVITNVGTAASTSLTDSEFVISMGTSTTFSFSAAGLVIVVGGETVTINGDVIAGMVSLLSHVHGGVEAGGSDTTVPVGGGTGT